MLIFRKLPLIAPPENCISKRKRISLSRILKATVTALLKEPDKVMFPKSNNR